MWIFHLSPFVVVLLAETTNILGMSFWSLVADWKLLQLPTEKTNVQLITKNLHFVFPKLVQHINYKDITNSWIEKFELLGIIIQDIIYFSTGIGWCLQRRLKAWVLRNMGLGLNLNSARYLRYNLRQVIEFLSILVSFSAK